VLLGDNNKDGLLHGFASYSIAGPTDILMEREFVKNIERKKISSRILRIKTKV
jgi:hypothetical protein